MTLALSSSKMHFVCVCISKSKADASPTAMRHTTNESSFIAAGRDLYKLPEPAAKQAAQTVGRGTPRRGCVLRVQYSAVSSGGVIDTREMRRQKTRSTTAVQCLLKQRRRTPTAMNSFVNADDPHAPAPSKPQSTTMSGTKHVSDRNLYELLLLYCCKAVHTLYTCMQGVQGAHVRSTSCGIQCAQDACATAQPNQAQHKWKRIWQWRTQRFRLRRSMTLPALHAVLPR